MKNGLVLFSIIVVLSGTIYWVSIQQKGGCEIGELLEKVTPENARILQSPKRIEKPLAIDWSWKVRIDWPKQQLVNWLTERIQWKLSPLDQHPFGKDVIVFQRREEADIYTLQVKESELGKVYLFFYQCRAW